MLTDHGIPVNIQSGAFRTVFGLLTQNMPFFMILRAVKGGLPVNATEAVSQCRKKLEKVTPLCTDCGRICGAACCRPMEAEETGMLLFPGEQALYEGKPEWKIQKAGQDLLIICMGECDREERPLSCRMFPLLPMEDQNSVRAYMDERARYVCPLVPSGIQGVRPEFRETIEECGRILLENPETRSFLHHLRLENEALRTLRKDWRVTHGRQQDQTDTEYRE